MQASSLKISMYSSNVLFVDHLLCYRYNIYCFVPHSILKIINIEEKAKMTERRQKKAQVFCEGNL